MNSMRKFPRAKGNAKERPILGEAYFMEYILWKLLHMRYISPCMKSEISMESENSNPN